MNEEILRAENLQKSFGGLRAIDSLNFAISQGQIKSVIGPNGAGKTTLFNLITGIFPPSNGILEFKGRSLNGLKPHFIAQLGISRTFQNLQLFANMTVLENAMVGRHTQTSAGLLSTGFRLSWMKKEEKEIEEQALAELSFMGLEEKAALEATSMPLGEQKLLEIARALATYPKLLLLDEPAAGLNIRETEKLCHTIRKIQQRGITIILVEHDMSLVMEISDEVLVLNYGKKVAEGTPRDIQRNPEVIAAYLGEEIGDA
ncbi:MAG: ABC transporter ATP-binding protein [Deltaproteobacteria bacterium]|jgi:branched-chain amino acid transport system ATP-binding protein|nr:ABC transporter ATP-binding protein [Deltaproteobacteria bacterium]